MSIYRLIVKRMWYCCCCCSVASHIQLIVTPWSAECQASLSTPTPGVCSNLCPSNQWCHPTITSSVVPFSSCLQSFPASGSFPMSQIFASGGQRIGVIATASVLPANIQDWFRIDWFDLLAVQGTLKSSPTPQLKSINSSVLSFLHSSTLASIHDHWKNHSLD